MHLAGSFLGLVLAEAVPQPEITARIRHWHWPRAASGPPAQSAAGSNLKGDTSPSPRRNRTRAGGGGRAGPWPPQAAEGKRGASWGGGRAQPASLSTLALVDSGLPPEAEHSEIPSFLPLSNASVHIESQCQKHDIQTTTLSVHLESACMLWAHLPRCVYVTAASGSLALPHDDH